VRERSFLFYGGSGGGGSAIEVTYGGNVVRRTSIQDNGKNGSNFGKLSAIFSDYCADSAVGSAKSAAILAMGLPPPSLLKSR